MSENTHISNSKCSFTIESSLITFPLLGKNNKKNPGFPNWNKLEKSIPHNGAYGVLCGKKGGITVIDVDVFKNGIADPDTFLWLGKNNRYLTKTKWTLTGSKNYHFYFKYTPLFDGRTQHFSKDKGHPVNIDILNNDSQCVGAGSYGTYHGFNVDILEMPEELKEELKKISKLLPRCREKKDELTEYPPEIAKYDPFKDYPHNSYIDWRCHKIKPGHCCGCTEDQTYIRHDKKTGKIFFKCQDYNCGAEKTIREATLFDFFNIGDQGYAKYFFKLFKDDLIYTGKKEKWYYWDGVMWRNDNECMYIVNLIATQFFDKLEAQLREQKSMMEEETFKRIRGKIWKISDSINYRESIEKSSRHYFFNKDIEWNMNPYSYTFSNGVYNLLTHKFGPSSKEDYVNDKITTGYDYEDSNQRELMEFEESYLYKVFPEKELREIYYKYLATSLTGISVKKFLFANGMSNAGKSLLMDLQLKMWGEYGYKGNNQVLLGRSTGACPEIANFHMKRGIVFEEPDSNCPFNGGLIKEITGSETLNARACYSNSTKTVLMSTFFCCCNDKPKIKTSTPEHESAIKNRVIDFPFKSEFVSQLKGYEDKPFAFLGNPRLKRPDIMNKNRILLFNVIKHYVDDNLIEDKDLLNKELIKRRNDYMNTCDIFYDWIMENTINYDGEDWYEKGYYISSKEMIRKFKYSPEYDENKKMYHKVKVMKDIIKRKCGEFHRERVQKKGTKDITNVLIKLKFIEDEDECEL